MSPVKVDIELRDHSHAPSIRSHRRKWFFQRRYDMNGRFQMQGGKNWILPK
jgi:hypothetical protein